jgi:protein-L-isoaspartate(D-aspartate) O-methyltransferase
MDYQEARTRMVERQLRRRGIRDEKVLQAMLIIPRELFLPPSMREYSYQDEPVTIGHGQTISQPYMTALMVQCLELTGEETVLEVGAGSGYHAAVLASLAKRVITVEVVMELAETARFNLEAAGFGERVTVVCEDGSMGYAAGQPYAGISVAAAAPEVPEALLAQLKDPGKLVIPVGSREEQELLVISRKEGLDQVRTAAYCRFVPLLGREGWN